MLGNIGGPGFLILILLALLLWGPDKIPGAIANLRRFISKLRSMATNAADTLSSEIGTEVKPEDLNPKAFVRKHVLSEDDQAMLTNPLKATAEDLKKSTKPLSDESQKLAREADDAGRAVRESTKPKRTSSESASTDASESSDAPSQSEAPRSRASFDDAT
ncbi:Sec-independent protein translocase family protein [Salininema proteolyticum]|uniref:Preprotein translocase subunit TatB n=1 Tax=Salininema proteolyticum TaxID=1607685 RepID=A0ABV8TYG4_9ACTN